MAKDKETAEAKFKEINEAYEVLGDPGKRSKYDALGQNWRHMGDFDPSGFPGAGGAAWQGPAAGEEFEFHFEGSGFSDFFESLFGGRARRGAGFDPFGGGGGGWGRPAAGRRARGPVRGQDIEADILVSLHEAAHGSERVIKLQAPVLAGGERKVRFRIPSGVVAGQRIRLAGYGGPGANGGPDGDLFLQVRLERHPDFRTDGHDLYYDLQLAPWEAVLGAVAPVRSLYGEVRLKIPPGTEAGTSLRIRGKGLPTGEGDKKGDLYAVVRIAVPGSVNDEERRLWSELASRSSFDPRG